MSNNLMLTLPPQLPIDLASATAALVAVSTSDAGPLPLPPSPLPPTLLVLLPLPLLLLLAVTAPSAHTASSVTAPDTAAASSNCRRRLPLPPPSPPLIAALCSAAATAAGDACSRCHRHCRGPFFPLHPTRYPPPLPHWTAGWRGRQTNGELEGRCLRTGKGPSPRSAHGGSVLPWTAGWRGGRCAGLGLARLQPPPSRPAEAQPFLLPQTASWRGAGRAWANGRKPPGLGAPPSSPP